MWFESRPVRTSASGPPSSLPAAAFPVLPNPVFLRLPQPPAGAQAALPPPVLCAHGTPDPAQSAGPAGPPRRVFLALRPPGQRWERAALAGSLAPFSWCSLCLGVRPSHLSTEGHWEEGSPGSGRKEAGAEWSPRWGCLLPSSPGRDTGYKGEREGADHGRGPGRTLLCLGAPAPSARSLLPNFPTQPFTSSGTGCRHRLTRSCPREPRVAHVWTDLIPMPGGRVTGSTWGWEMGARAPGRGGGLLALPLFSWPFPPFPLAPIVPSPFLFLGHG